MSLSHDSETPAGGQQVITACAFIHRTSNGKPQLFLPRRAESKKFLPGVFELPGGHIEYEEDIVVGLQREIREEFDLEIKVGDPFAAFTYNNPVKGSHSIEVIYFATFVDPNPEIILHPEDHSEYRWITIEEVEEVQSEVKNQDDPEIKAIQRGFALLLGAAPRTS